MNIKRKTKIKNIIPVSSMSDIAFLLLIFLMLSSILNMKKGPTVNLPEAGTIQRPAEQQKYEISIDKNGNYYFEDSYLTENEITSIFSGNILLYPDLYVQISADELCKYDMVDKLIKALQAAECYRLLFVCNKINGKHNDL